MKSFGNQKSIIAITLALGSSLVVQAQNVISWNADSWSTISYPGEYSGATAQYAGIVPATYWNSTWYSGGNPTSPSPYTRANLLDNGGATTAMSVTSSSFGNSWNYISVNGNLGAQPDANNYLLNGYNNRGGDSSVTLSSIPFAQYDLYVYFTSDTAGRAGTVNVGSTTYDFSTLAGTAIHSGGTADMILTTDTAGNNPGADYAVFTGLAGNSQTISVTVPSWGGIAGFQVVATPEPGTLTLVAMGGMGLLMLGRRVKARC